MYMHIYRERYTRIRESYFIRTDIHPHIHTHIRTRSAVCPYAYTRTKWVRSVCAATTSVRLYLSPQRGRPLAIPFHEDAGVRVYFHTNLRRRSSGSLRPSAGSARYRGGVVGAETGVGGAKPGGFSPAGAAAGVTGFGRERDAGPGLAQSLGKRRSRRGRGRCPRRRDGGGGGGGGGRLRGRRGGAAGPGSGRRDGRHGRSRRSPAAYRGSGAGAGAGGGAGGRRGGGGAGDIGKSTARRLGRGHRPPAQPQRHGFRGDAAPRLHLGLPPRANPLRDHPLDPAGLPRQDRWAGPSGETPPPSPPPPPPRPPTPGRPSGRPRGRGERWAAGGWWSAAGRDGRAGFGWLEMGCCQLGKVWRSKWVTCSP